MPNRLATCSIIVLLDLQCLWLSSATHNDLSRHSGGCRILPSYSPPACPPTCPPLHQRFQLPATILCFSRTSHLPSLHRTLGLGIGRRPRSSEEEDACAVSTFETGGVMPLAVIIDDRTDVWETPAQTCLLQVREWRGRHTKRGGPGCACAVPESWCESLRDPCKV